MPGATRLILCEKYRIRREGLRLLLSRENDFEIAVDVADMAEALVYIRQERIDVCVVSLDPFQLRGDPCVVSLRELSLYTNVLLLNDTLDEAPIYPIIQAGIKGYLSGDITSGDLARAIREISAGRMWIQAERADLSLENWRGYLWREHDRVRNLTAQEIRTLNLIRQGLRNKEIAGRLHIAEKTVKCHVHHIFQKLKITRRTELMH